MEAVARDEGREIGFIREGLGRGTIVIPANRNHKNLVPRGIGAGLRTKVNANIGTSTGVADTGEELAKLRAALAAGADTIMDLSTGGDLDALRRRILAECPVPVGTVPVYQAAVEAKERYGSIVAMTADGLFDVIERHAADGVDFLTVHCGVTREAVGRLRAQGRLTDIVSRGGALLAGWMLHHDRENPLTNSSTVFWTSAWPTT
jgi:phosphomethylpyrimidine synthase